MNNRRTQRIGTGRWLTMAAISTLSLTALGTALTGCTSKPPPQPQIVTAGTSGGMGDSEQQSVDLAKGQKLQVRLKSSPNATWRMGGTDFGGDVVDVIGHKTETDSTMSESGGNWDIFDLQAKKAGQAHLEFADQGAERTMPTKRLKLDVTVR